MVSYKADTNGYRIISPTVPVDLGDRSMQAPEAIDAAAICSLLGRCANEDGTGNINPEASV